MKAHFLTMAQYNAWANLRLYRMAAALTDEQYRQSTGVYFRSLHGTLNHILSTDRIWLGILTTGVGNKLDKADVILFDDLPSLAAARIEEDAKIIAFLERLSERDFDEIFRYQIEGNPGAQTRREILAHLFNHETHHRGQAHAILTLVGVAEPKSLDLFTMQLERAVAAS
jgi:uncharacterized damage-inducible protein DinB